MRVPRFFLLESISIAMLSVTLLCGCTGAGNDVRIKTGDGTIILSLLRSNAIRVQVVPEGSVLPEELVYTEKVKAPRYRVSKDDSEPSVYE